MFEYFKKKFQSKPPPVEPVEPVEVIPTPSLSPPPPPPPSIPPTPTPTPLPHPSTPEPTQQKPSWLNRLKEGLAKTGHRISHVLLGSKVDEALFEELEAALLMADCGWSATETLMKQLRDQCKSASNPTAENVRQWLIDLITAHLRPLERSLAPSLEQNATQIWMVAGVNGAGKTTSIGKLTHHLAQSGASVLLAAADTFRAAAREQLGTWADRNQVDIVSQAGADPAAVCFDATQAGMARHKKVVMVDTAGRLPTQTHLMEELKKIKRTITRAHETAPTPHPPSVAPHEVLLVIDGNTGQNALNQVKAFDDALGLTGLIITKLDGTAKGGVLLAIASERPIPIDFIGVGEQLDDLQRFDAHEYAHALLATHGS